MALSDRIEDVFKKSLSLCVYYRHHEDSVIVYHKMLQIFRGTSCVCSFFACVGLGPVFVISGFVADKELTSL